MAVQNVALTSLIVTGVTVSVLLVCRMLYSYTSRERPAPDDSEFRHILALLASCRTVIVTRQTTKT